MKTYTRNVLWTAAAWLAVAPVMAQTATAPAAQAAAQPAAGGLEEIVITAQKRTERLQDVPVSASVLSADTIGRMNAGDISDLNRLVPSVNLNGTINGRVPLGIRGISTVQSEFNVGLASGVAVMIDGVPVPSDSRAANALEDIQSVEVLKGPQATLGGRTAAQGVINFVTRKPSDTFNGNINLMQTDDKEFRVNGYVAGPITNGLDYSVAAYYTKRTFPITNTTLNQDTSEKIYGVRGKLLFKPNDNLDITLAGRIGQDNSTGFNFVYTHLAPGICLLIGPCPPAGTKGFPLGFLEQSVLLPGITPSFNNLKYASPISAYSNVKDADVSLDVQYRLGNLTLGSTTAYQHEEQVNVQDLFAVNNFFWNLLSGAPGSGAPPFYNIQTQAIDVKQLSEELKLASPTDQPFSYLVGMFYSDTKVSLQLGRALFPALDNYTADPETKTTDLYGRTTWKFMPDNALVTGLRFNYDQLSYTYNQTSYDAYFPPPGGGPPTLYFNFPPAAGSHSESTLVGDVSLQHYYTRDVMAYATYARGYAPAVYNMAQNLTPANPTVALAPKTDIDSLEIGTKGTYFDRHLTVNASAFYTKYKNFQAQAVVANGSPNPPSLLVPADAETKGVELDVVAAPTQYTRLNLNVAYVDAVFTHFKNAPCYDPEVQTSPATLVPAGCTAVAPGAGVQDASGKPMPNAPKWKYTVGAEQRIPVANGAADVVLGGDFSYRGAAQMLANQNPDAILPSVGILNLNIGVDVLGSKTKVTAFVNNVTDKVYYTDLEDTTSAVVGQPARDAHRYYGIRINQSF
jgi:iron complex outermembrane recepter protein